MITLLFSAINTQYQPFSSSMISQCPQFLGPMCLMKMSRICFMLLSIMVGTFIFILVDEDIKVCCLEHILDGICNGLEQ